MIMFGKYQDVRLALVALACFLMYCIWDWKIKESELE